MLLKHPLCSTPGLPWCLFTLMFAPKFIPIFSPNFLFLFFFKPGELLSCAAAQAFT
jgi:hypothetical protein